MELVVGDDGIGMQHRVDESELNSLGIDLMRGLTRDLKGNIIFDTGAGTTITVLFAVDIYSRIKKSGIKKKAVSG